MQFINFFCCLCISSILVRATETSTGTVNDHFNSILELLKGSFHEYDGDYFHNLVELNNTLSKDPQSDLIMTDIIDMRYQIISFKVLQNKVRKFQIKNLEIFVNIYINKQLKNTEITEFEKLQKTLFALKSQLETMQFVTKLSLKQLMQYINNQFIKYNIINKKQIEGDYGMLTAEEDEKYVFQSTILIVKGIAYLVICFAVSSILCMSAIGTLLTVQLIIWMLVLARWLSGNS